MLHHYTVRRMPLEGLGVSLFFVLSGYFSTFSLLRLREKVVQGELTTAGALRLFYWRRWMRIVPVCLVVVSLAALAGVPFGREHFFSLAFFTSNFSMIREYEWFGRFSPLWSLAALEQIYLVWPLAVLCCPRRWITGFMLVCMAVAPVFLTWCHQTMQPGFVWFMVPLAWLDQIGAGALLAWCYLRGSAKHFVQITQPFALLCVVFMVLEECGWRPPFHAIGISSLSALLGAWVVAGAATGYSGWVAWFLENWLLIRMGQLSYGIFLLHNFTELLIPRWGWLGAALSSDWQFLILMPATVLLAMLMHHFIERPILQFSRREKGETQRQVAHGKNLH